MIPLNPLPFLGMFWGKYRLQVAALLLLLAAFLAWSHHEYRKGVQAQVARDERALKAAEAKAAKTTTQLQTRASETGSQSRQAQTRILTRTKTLIERIPYAVPASSDPQLGPGWLRTYDASLGLSEGPGIAAGADKPDPGLRSSDALRTIVGNNADCSLWQDRAERLTELYNTVREKVNGP